MSIPLLIREQERSICRESTDTPAAREARIVAHIARIEALGLSGAAWDEATRMNVNALRRARCGPSRKEQRRAEADRKRLAKLAAYMAEIQQEQAA